MIDRADESARPDPESLSDQVVSRLQRKILSGEIAIGSWLRHGAIAEEFGISRTPVREALRILAAQGIVTIDANRGARVNGQSSQDIREIGEVRAELEGLAATLACDRMDDEQLAEMTDSWQSFRTTLDEPTEQQAKAWVVANERFHSVIMESAGNPHLAATIRDLRRKLPHNLSFGAYAGNSRLIARNLSQHQAIADAIIAQDAELARVEMVKHIKFSIDATARWVERNAAGGEAG